MSGRAWACLTVELTPPAAAQFRASKNQLQCSHCDSARGELGVGSRTHLMEASRSLGRCPKPLQGPLRVWTRTPDRSSGGGPKQKCQGMDGRASRDGRSHLDAGPAERLPSPTGLPHALLTGQPRARAVPTPRASRRGVLARGSLLQARHWAGDLGALERVTLRGVAGGDPGPG